VFLCHFHISGLFQVIHTLLIVTQIYLGETPVEQDFGSEEFKLQAQLFIISMSRKTDVNGGGKLSCNTYIAGFPRK